MQQSIENQVVRYQGNFYLVEGNSLRQIPDLAGFFNGRYQLPQETSTSVLQEFRPTQEIEKLEESGFKKYELGKPLKPEGERIHYYADDFLGAGHWMETNGGMTREGALFAVTKTQTVTWFGGFHGAVHVLCTDAQGIPVALSAKRRFGVDGTWIGTSLRYDHWSDQIGEAAAAATHGCTILHSWDPDSFQQRIDNLIRLGERLQGIINALRDIAAISGLFTG